MISIGIGFVDTNPAAFCRSVLLLALAAQAQGASGAARPQHFDLICSGNGHVAADPHPRSRGTYPANERYWHSQSHYIVDLRTRRYCERWTCVNYGARAIVAANARELILANDRLTATTNAYSLVVRMRDGTYRIRQQADDGHTRVETGSCRRARFSGFPNGTRPAPG